MAETREEKLKRLEYLHGYRDAVNDSWEIFLKMAKDGYSQHEMMIVTKTKSSSAKINIEDKIRELESELGSTDIIDSDAVKPIPVVEEPIIQVVKDMKPGLSYMIEELKPQKCFALFRREVENGRTGLAVVRKAPGQIDEFDGVSIKKIIWLTKSQKTDNHTPIGMIALSPEEVEEDDFDYIGPSQLPKLYSVILDFLSGNPGCIVVLEGLEYMISHNGFNSVLSFVQSLTESMVTKKGTLIVSLNPDALESREMSLLKKDMN